MSKRAETIGQCERGNTGRVSVCDALMAVATVSQRQNVIYDDHRTKTQDPSRRATENEHAGEQAGESHRCDCHMHVITCPYGHDYRAL